MTWNEPDPARRFMWAIQALALDATEQLQLFPEFADSIDELELDQAQTQAAFLESSQSLVSAEQLQAIADLDAQLDAMAGPENAALWSDEALEAAPEWQRVRALAAALLRQMGWPLEAPPRDRAIYVGPPSK